MKTQNHQFYIGNTYISLSPNTPCCTSFRRLVDQNFIANRLRILSSASGVHRCLRQNHSKRWTKRTMPARGSFDATKLAKHLSISVDRSCSTLCKGSLWPFFGLRTARRHLLSASNHGIISFPKGKPMVGTPQWATMSTESGGLCMDRVPLGTPNPSSIGPLCTLWGSPNSSVP